MQEYSGNQILFPLRKGYASQPDAIGIPLEPPIDEYMRGTTPLQTLPAPHWNWFIGHLTNNSALTGEALSDLYAELDSILVDAGIAPDEASTSQMLQAITILIQRRTVPLENRVTAAEGQINLLETDTIPNVVDKVTTIEGKIPNQASASNQLADKDFVNSSVAGMAARYITPDAAGNNQWASLQALRNGPWYSGGTPASPSQNDYAIFTNTDNSTWRAAYNSNLWSPTFKINDTPLTAAQLAAINSSITAALVNKIVNPDTIPTQGSTELITSGGVWSFLANKSIIDESRVILLENTVFGINLFVTVSNSGRIAYSADAINWTTVTVGASAWYGITYANGLFVTVSSSGDGRIAYSADAINWTTVTVGTSAWWGITYANGVGGLITRLKVLEERQ